MTRSGSSSLLAPMILAGWRTCSGLLVPSRFVMKRLETLALTVLTLMCGACDYYYYRIPSPDDLWHIIPWFDHMIHARYIHPYETQNVPRNTPAGTVPVSGGEPDWS